MAMFIGLCCRSKTSTITTTISAILLSTTAASSSSSSSHLIYNHYSRPISTTAAFFVPVSSSSAPLIFQYRQPPIGSPRFVTLNNNTMMSSSSSSSSSTTIYKRAKLSHLPISTKLIGTHSGTFQADEALGVWLLRQTPTYRNAKVIRSRDESILEKCDIVLDVGGVYDHEKLRYDHHQRGYEERFAPKKVTGKIGGSGSVVVERCTKLSASGLIYRHYGKEVICEYYPQLLVKDSSSPNSDDDDVLDWVYTKMYDSFMEAIDAIDTGVEPLPPSASAGGVVFGSDDNQPLQLVYRDNTGLSSRVSRINPRWNEEVDESTGAPPNPDARFEIASEMCGQDFMSMLTKIVESDLPARTIVQLAVQSRHDVDSSGEIICLPSGGLPWKNEVYELEKEFAIGTTTSSSLIKYVLYTDQSNMWRIQCVSVEGKAFENRRSLPESWRGLRDEELCAVSGIGGCTFVHASGFIGGNASYEGVLEMARKALK